MSKFSSAVLGAVLGTVGLCFAAGIAAAYFKLANSTGSMPAVMLQASATMFTITFAVMAFAFPQTDERIAYWLEEKKNPSADAAKLLAGQQSLRELMTSLLPLAAAAVLLFAAFVLAALAAGITTEVDQARRVLVSSSLGTTILAAEGFLVFMWLTMPFGVLLTVIGYLDPNVTETPAAEASASAQSESLPAASAPTAPAPSEAQPARADLSELARPVEPPTAT